MLGVEMKKTDFSNDAQTSILLTSSKNKLSELQFLSIDNYISIQPCSCNKFCSLRHNNMAVKRMAEALGGTVSFESQEGKGTTFIVRLPPLKPKKVK